MLQVSSGSRRFRLWQEEEVAGCGKEQSMLVDREKSFKVAVRSRGCRLQQKAEVAGCGREHRL